MHYFSKDWLGTILKLTSGQLVDKTDWQCFGDTLLLHKQISCRGQESPWHFFQEKRVILSLLDEYTTNDSSSPPISPYQWAPKAGVNWLAIPGGGKLPAIEELKRLDNHVIGTLGGDSSIWISKGCDLLLTLDYTIIQMHSFLTINCTLVKISSK